MSYAIGSEVEVGGKRGFLRKLDPDAWRGYEASYFVELDGPGSGRWFLESRVHLVRDEGFAR